MPSSIISTLSPSLSSPSKMYSPGKYFNTCSKYDPIMTTGLSSIRNSISGKSFNAEKDLVLFMKLLYSILINTSSDSIPPSEGSTMQSLVNTHPLSGYTIGLLLELIQMFVCNLSLKEINDSDRGWINLLHSPNSFPRSSHPKVQEVLQYFNFLL